MLGSYKNYFWLCYCLFSNFINDVVYKFNNGATYDPANGYVGIWLNGEPTLNVAQGLFYYSVGPNNWEQHFTP